MTGSYTVLQTQNISKSYGIHPVLQGVSFLLNAGERIGLVGANGVGKSTLLKIIAGQVEPDGGSVQVRTGARVGYLAQRIDHVHGRTVAEFITEALADLHAMEARMRELEAQMAATDAHPDHLEAIMAEYSDLLDAFDRQGGYEMENRTAAVLDGLQISHISQQRDLATLSGGEKSRFALAGLLLGAPDLLVLDEPTNHLDFAMLTWLEETIRDYRGAVAIVSHDRTFLNRTVNSIVELDEHTRTARHYTGDYDAYLLAKAHERRRWERDYAQQQDEIKDLQYTVKVGARSNRNYRAHGDGDKMLRNAKIAKHESTVAKRIRAAEERLNRILADPIPQPPEDLQFEADFNPKMFEGRVPVSVDGVCKQYGGQSVLKDVSFALHATSRVVLVGANGAGKSTLIRILMGIEAADSGHVQISPAVRVGYLDQEGRHLHPAMTVFEAYSHGLDDDEQRLKAILLNAGLFRFEDFDKRVGDLSSGQRRKVQIGRLMAGGYNLLMLDEPTNDVSFDVVEGLEDALVAFPGPIIAASHDRRFIQRFGGAVWLLEDGHLHTEPDPATLAWLHEA